MGQINEATIRMFKTRLARGEHINSTHSEEEQLVNAWEKLQSASISEPVNQQMLVALKALIDMDVAYQRGPKVEQAVEAARAAIADRYASKVQPEPVNQRLLAALKRLLHKAYKQNWQDNYPSEVECAEAAIAAAEAAQPVEQPRCACGDSFTSDAVCANCLAAQRPASAQPVAVPDEDSDDYAVEQVIPQQADVLRGASQLLVDALEKLARLGAGDRYGNSDGNVIAQQALAEYRTMLSAAQPVAVPDGYVLAPASATPEMIEAAENVEDLYRRGTPNTWSAVYHAMLKAAKKGGAA